MSFINYTILRLYYTFAARVQNTLPQFSDTLRYFSKIEQKHFFRKILSKYFTRAFNADENFSAVACCPSGPFNNRRIRRTWRTRSGVTLCNFYREPLRSLVIKEVQLLCHFIWHWFQIEHLDSVKLFEANL